MKHRHYHPSTKKDLDRLYWQDDRRRINALKPEHGGSLPPDSWKLLRVTSDYFAAGAIFARINGVWSCIDAAPIIKWMKGKNPDQIKISLLKMGATYEWICCDMPCSTPAAELLKSTGVAGVTGVRNTAHEILTAGPLCPQERY